MTFKKKISKTAKDIRKATGISFIASIAISKALLSGTKTDIIAACDKHDVKWLATDVPLSDDVGFWMPTIVGTKGRTYDTW